MSGSADRLAGLHGRGEGFRRLTLGRVLGEPSLFDLDDAGALEKLSLRERRLLVGALNFHALMAPGRRLEVHVYAGGVDNLPRTTDDSTFDGLSREFRSRTDTITITSRVSDEGVESSRRSLRLTASPRRHILVSPDIVLSADPPRGEPSGLVRRNLRRLRTKAPLIYDELRDLELLRHRSSRSTRAERRDYEREFAKGGIHEHDTFVPAPPAIDGAPRAVLIGVHWFELGGAEKWAFETVRRVREAGFVPIVLSNRDSHQPWIGRPELDGALVIPFSEPTVFSQTPGIEEVLRGIFRTFDVRGVVVHHNQWLYDRLHWIARSRAGIRVVDSTHIVEYRGGGFPRVSAQVTDAISIHHVISPSLASWMIDTQGIATDRVKMAPLTDLTVSLDARASFRPRRPEDPFTVAFVGRMARQKAPEVFVAMAAKLRMQLPRVRFIMHGDGELAGWVDDLLAARGLADVVERRDSSIPVARTLEGADVLVITSHNEGLTLTTFEAVQHGVPVVSTDVGGQRDVVPSEALIPRNVHRAASRASKVVAALARNEDERARLWERERSSILMLQGMTPASEWFSEEIAKW